MSKDPVRIGIIGTGGIARAYARAYREIPEAEVVGLCDIIPGKELPMEKEKGSPRPRATSATKIC